MTGCERCGVGPDDDCTDECPSRLARPVTYRLTIDDDNTGRRPLIPDDMVDLDIVTLIFDAMKAMVTAPGNKREGDAVELLLTDEHGGVIRHYERSAT